MNPPVRALPGTPEYRRILVALACAGLATFAQLYSPQGILPLIVAELGVSPSTAALTVSFATLGLAASVLPWSFASDRMGRVRAMKAAAVTAAILALTVPLAPSIHALLVLRTVEGAALGGVAAVAIAYLNEVVDAHHAAAASAVYIAATSLGGLSGRLLAAPVAEIWGWRSGVGSVGLISAAAALVFVWIVPRSVPVDPGLTTADLDRPAVLRVLVRDRSLLAMFAQGCFLMGGFVATYNYLAFHLEQPPFGLPVTVTSLLFLAYLAGTWSSRKAGTLVPRYGAAAVLRFSTLIMAGGILLTLIPHLASVIAGLVTMTVGFFAAHAVASGTVGRLAVRGRAQAGALYNLAYYAGSSLFGWFGGVLFAWAGWPSVVALVAGLCGAALWAARWFVDRQPASAPHNPPATDAGAADTERKMP